MDVRSLFKRAFAHTPPRVVRVPASLELMGGHTEAQQGLVLSLAVDRFVEFACVPRFDGKIELVGDRAEQRVSFWGRDCEAGQIPGWAAPVAGVIRRLRDAGGSVKGFNAAWTSGIPEGIGFGEHAALGTAAALGLRHLFPFAPGPHGFGAPPKPDRRGEKPKLSGRERMHFAEFCHAAELGMRVGDNLLHAFAAPLMNREHEITQLDCLHRTVEHHPLPPGLTLVHCDTGLRDPRRGLHRSRFDALCRQVGERAGLRSLRSVSVEDVNKALAKMEPAHRGAARFVAGECARIVLAEQSLRRGEIGQFGECLFQSHAAARAEAGLSVPELDLLVEEARAHPGCIGARFAGSGSDGGTLNLVAWTQVDSFVDAMKNVFARATGRVLESRRLKVVAGADG
jgi:galactokinase